MRYNGLLKKYASCCICHWDRGTIDLAHKKPAVEGGQYAFDNIIPLCPNHHRLFDRGQLRADEYNAIGTFTSDVLAKIKANRGGI